MQLPPIHEEVDEEVKDESEDDVEEEKPIEAKKLNDPEPFYEEGHIE